MPGRRLPGQATAAQLFPQVESHPEPPSPASHGKKGRPAKAKKPGTPSAPASPLPLANAPAHVEVILLTCLEKGIDPELILEQWQVSQLEDLDDHQVLQVQEWLKSQ